MLKRIRKAWTLYRHGAAFKGLLEALGLWKYVLVGASVIVSTLLAIWSGLPGWLEVLVGLVIVAILLAIGGFAVALYRTWNLPSRSIAVPAQELREREKGYQAVPAEPAADLRSELELRRTKRNDGVLLFLENTTDRTLKGCGLTVAMLSRFYEEMHDFIRPHEFTTINLLEPQDLLPKQRSSEAYLVHHKPYYYSAPTIGNPTNNPPRAVPEPGVWRADIHIFSVPHKAYVEQVFFQWQSGVKADFTPNPIPAIPNEITKEKSQSDQGTLEALRKLLPNEGGIMQLRDQPFLSRFPWDADAVLLSFLQRDAGPDHGFLDEHLEELRRQLHEAIKLLLDRVHRYSYPLSDISGSSGTVRIFWKRDNEDIATYDAQRKEVFEAANRVCALYDELVLTARRNVGG